MDDLRDIELEKALRKSGEGSATATNNLIGKITQRLKPGPKKKDKTRTEKVSCRLTAAERADGLRYCKAHGLTEAKLLRGAYLAAITQAPDDKITKLAEAITRSPDQSLDGIKAILKKGGMVLLFILLGGLAVPTVAKYFLHRYADGPIIYGPHDVCVYHQGDTDGCEMKKYNELR